MDPVATLLAIILFVCIITILFLARTIWLVSNLYLDETIKLSAKYNDLYLDVQYAKGYGELLERAKTIDLHIKPHSPSIQKEPEPEPAKQSYLSKLRGVTAGKTRRVVNND
jgi:hypothetical protein